MILSLNYRKSASLALASRHPAVVYTHHQDNTAVAARGWTGQRGKQEDLWGRSIPLASVQLGTATIKNKACGEWVSQTSPHGSYPEATLIYYVRFQSETRVLNSRKSRRSWSMVYGLCGLLLFRAKWKTRTKLMSKIPLSGSHRTLCREAVLGGRSL